MFPYILIPCIVDMSNKGCYRGGMKLINKTGLPDSFLNFAEKDPYSKGHADFSVTQLIDSPKISQLQEENNAELEVDVADRVWALMGTAVHSILEGGAGPDDIVEERIFVTVNGKVVSGAVDVLTPIGDSYEMDDYKLTRAWSVMADKPEWEKQLNTYRVMLHMNGKKIDSLNIIAIIRDWSAKKAQFDRNYPQKPIIKIEIPIWPLDKAEAFLLERVTLHSASRAASEPFPCIDIERWTRPERYAVMKKGTKRALKIWPTRKDAERYAGECRIKFTGDYFVEERPAEHVRCEGNYCQVNQWCNQWGKS